MNGTTPVFPVSGSPAPGAEAPASPEIPPLRWIMVGYFFWVGIFLGALIMHAATGY